MPAADAATPVGGVAGRHDVVPDGVAVDDEQREHPHGCRQLLADRRPQVQHAPFASLSESVHAGQDGERRPLEQHDPRQVADQDLHDVAAAAPLGEQLSQSNLQTPHSLPRDPHCVVDAVELEPHELHLRRDASLLVHDEAGVGEGARHLLPCAGDGLAGPTEHQEVVDVDGSLESRGGQRHCGRAVAEQPLGGQPPASGALLDHELAEVQRPAPAHGEHGEVRGQQVPRAGSAAAHDRTADSPGPHRLQPEGVAQLVGDGDGVEGVLDVSSVEVADVTVSRFELAESGRRRQLSPRRRREVEVGPPCVEYDPLTSALLGYHEDAQRRRATGGEGEAHHATGVQLLDEARVVGDGAEGRIGVRAHQAQLLPKAVCVIDTTTRVGQ